MGLIASTTVLETIGLTAGDEPLIEWQAPSDTGPIVPASVAFVGSTTINNTATEIALPAGVLPGDLLVLSITSGGFTSIQPTCSDPRMTTVYNPAIYRPWDLSFKPHLVAAGIADSSADPVAISVSDPEVNGKCLLSVYRVTGATTIQLSAETAPVPPAGTFGQSVLVTTWAAGDVGIFHDVADWTEDVAVNSTNQRQGNYSAPGTPAWVYPHSYSPGLSLWIGVADGTTLDPEPGVTIWAPDPDRSHALLSYTLSYGRNDPRSKTQATQISVKAAAGLTPAPQTGEVFRVALCSAAATALGLTESEAARFTGEVTDVELDPAARTWQIVGVAAKARQGRTPLDLTARPAEPAAFRVAAILAGIGGNTGVIDAGGALIAAPETPDASGSALLDVVSDSTAGQIVTQLDGRIDWHGAEHRRGSVPVLTLTTHEILREITWAQHVGSVVNVASVNYAGGVVTVTDHRSVEARERYPLTFNTALTNSAAASSFGSLIVGRYSVPRWELPTLPIDIARTIDPAHLADFLRLRFGARLTLTGLPVDGPVTGDHDVFLEGFTETATQTAWRMAISVSDPALSGVSIRWVDVDPDLRWVDVDPAIRWLDVAAIEDPNDLGSPTYAIDGGDAGTTTYARSFIGGNAGTTTTTRTIDGGLAA